MLVSVIIPVFNREAFIRETLLSVRRQTYRPIELVVVDNGSTDASPRLCREFADEAQTRGFAVRLLTERRRGASACRNAGARATTGEWLYFFDSDDIMSAGFIANAVERILPSTQLVAAATNIEIGGKLRRRVFRYSADVEEQILTGELSTQSFIVHAGLLRSVGGWDETLPRWNDWELGVRLLLARPGIAWLRGKAYHAIRAHADSITGSSFSASAGDLLKACRAVERDVRQAGCAPGKPLAALAYRVYMLAGIFVREHSPLAAAEARAYADSLAAGGAQRVAGRALMRYVAAGGRGAWLAARALVAM